IVLAPTRELVIQVCEEILSLRSDTHLSVAPIYGGQSIELQLKKLKQGVSIVVGTPGRVLDHIDRGSLKLDAIRYFILDEADEMLNMGFIDDIEKIFGYTPEDKRVLLLSATMPER
ncbi:DEAD/DEAH box helicase, partial [Bradyrhizobium sp. Ce-3]